MILLNQRRSITKAVQWNLIGSFFPLIVAIVTIPYTLQQVGYEVFGVISIFWALIGYFSLFDLGIGRSLTYEISKLLSEERAGEIKATIKSGLYVTLFTGLTGGIILWFSSHAFVTYVLNLSPALQADTVMAFKICSWAILATTITSGARGALEGMGRFGLSNLIKLYLGVGMFFTPALMIFFGYRSLVELITALVILRILGFLMALLALKPQFMSKHGSQVTKQHLSTLFRYGFWVTVTGVIGPLMVYGDRFIISATMGAATLPYYAIPQEGVLRMLIIPMAFTGALLPAMSAANLLELNYLFKKYFRKISIISVAMCIFVAVITYPILQIWISKEFADQAILPTLILVFGVWFNSVALVPFTLIQAKGRPKTTAIIHICEFLLYIPALLFFTLQFGLIGAAVTWTIRVVVDFFAMQFYAKRLIQL
jgi:O-antigen/teichoic acid export membrane protein